MNALLRVLLRTGAMIGIGKAIEYFATRGTEADSPESRTAAKTGRKSARRATRLIGLVRRIVGY